MSRFLAPLVLSAGVCVFFADAVPAAEQETSARPLPSASQARILAVLDQPTEFDFRERPLGEVIDFIKQKHGLQILLDSEAYGTDKPVTQTLKNISLRSALRLTLAQLNLAYVLRDGYLLITNDVKTDKKLSTKVYPVQDLVSLDSGFRPTPLTSDGANNSPSPSDMLPRPPFPGMGGMGMGRIDDEGDFSGLIEMITSTVAPTSWDEVGGPASITGNSRSRSITVSQTDEVHEEIVELLAALRRVRDEQLAAAKPIGPPPPEAYEPNRPHQVRAFRLMRRTLGPGKSGWRPPTPIVGDATPPGAAQAGSTKQKAPEPPVQGDPAKQAPPAQKVESSDKAKAAEPAKERESTAGGAQKRILAHAKDEKLESMVQEIVKLVPQIIEPQSWEPHGDGVIRAVGEGIVVRHTEEVQHRVARLMAELLPDCVPMDFGGPWGPWKAALEAGPTAVRLRPASTDNWPSQAEPRPCGQEARIYKALLETCDLEFTKLPLIDALNRLAEPRQVQLSIDSKVLADEGIDIEAPVTCSVKGLSYETAIELLLDERKLTYVIRHEVLLITTKTAAQNMLPVKVYPVFDLVFRPPKASANRPGLDFQSLIENITTNIAPSSWDEVGGPGGIQPFTNSAALVISQTTAVHKEIAEYLRAQREIAKAQGVNQ